jgi:RND family efflux transporter MFP subunit
MEIENQQPITPATEIPKQGLNRFRNWQSILFLAVMVVVVFAIYTWRKNVRPVVGPLTPVTVATARVTREDIFNKISIPAEFRPYVEVELHAKVSGYVDQMSVDFGDKVKSGQLLATLEVPELHDQLHNAIAMQESAETDYTNAHLIFNRLQAVNKEHPNLVAQQDLDSAQSRDGSTSAARDAARATVEKYQTLLKYTKITAPFDGVITRRYVDPGALIQAGTTSETQSLPLVRVSDNYHLRLDFYVSVDSVKYIHPGDPVEVQVDSLGGKRFTGKISRFTDRVEELTRQMTTEIEVFNPTLEIVPGMYASVMLKAEQHPRALVIPAEAIDSDKNPTVYVVNANSEIESRPVTLGLETPDKFEVISGLQEGDMVMIGRRSLVHSGQKVESKIVERAVAQ